MKNVTKGILVSSLLWSCGVDREKVDVVNGKDGHSMAVSTAAVGFDAFCPASNGQVLQFWIDLDDSSTVSENDKPASSLIMCNGVNGAAGTSGTVGIDF